MTSKILVTYASRAGSTAGIAEAIGAALANNDMQVEVFPMQEVEDLAAYRAVIAGSAIRGNRWLPEALQFLCTHRKELNYKPFAAFMVCITLAMPGADKHRQGLTGWMQPVRKLARPVSEGYFAGMLDFSRLPINPNTLLMRLAVVLHIFPSGDHRDWKAIHTWAETVRQLLI